MKIKVVRNCRGEPYAGRTYEGVFISRTRDNPDDKLEWITLDCGHTVTVYPGPLGWYPGVIGQVENINIGFRSDFVEIIEE